MEWIAPGLTPVCTQLWTDAHSDEGVSFIEVSGSSLNVGVQMVSPLGNERNQSRLAFYIDQMKVLPGHLFGSMVISQEAETQQAACNPLSLT